VAMVEIVVHGYGCFSVFTRIVSAMSVERACLVVESWDEHFSFRQGKDCVLLNVDWKTLRFSISNYIVNLSGQRLSQFQYGPFGDINIGGTVTNITIISRPFKMHR